MKIKELEGKIAELKTVAEPTEEQKKELSGLETQLAAETQAKTRFEELSAKDENLLTSEEVDEFLQLSEKFPEEAEPSAQPEPEPKKKYAGRYDTLEELINGYKSSEEERKRIEADPNASAALEDGYKDSQRKVTKLVADRKARPTIDRSNKPLNMRDFAEMTKEEYDTWEKTDKLSAHAWLSNAMRKESTVQESRLKVLKKYPNFVAEIQGIIEPSKELVEWDRLDNEHPEYKSDPNWPERCMVEMEKNLGIAKEPPKKSTVLKPDFAQGKTGGGGGSGKKRLTEAEFEALSPEDQRAYLESQKPASDR